MIKCVGSNCPNTNIQVLSSAIGQAVFLVELVDLLCFYFFPFSFTISQGKNEIKSGFHSPFSDPPKTFCTVPNVKCFFQCSLCPISFTDSVAQIFFC